MELTSDEVYCRSMELKRKRKRRLFCGLSNSRTLELSKARRSKRRRSRSNLDCSQWRTWRGTEEGSGECTVGVQGAVEVWNWRGRKPTADCRRLEVGFVLGFGFSSFFRLQHASFLVFFLKPHFLFSDWGVHCPHLTLAGSAPDKAMLIQM